jgi:hypothetical protein
LQKKLLAVCLNGDTSVDWDEVERLAALPDFKVTSELKTIMKEVRSELET